MNGFRRFIDLVNERLGAFRIRAMMGRNFIAWSARVKSPSRLSLGRGVIIQQGAILHCGGKRWSAFGGGIKIGDGAVIGPNCVLYGAGEIEVGDFVHFGPGAQIMTQAGLDNATRFSASPTHKFAPVFIGEGSWIGAGAVILGGSRLGRGVTVSPNSVVAGGNVPDHAVLVGNPARILRINEG